MHVYLIIITLPLPLPPVVCPLLLSSSQLACATVTYRATYRHVGEHLAVTAEGNASAPNFTKLQRGAG